jgi:hypothetical protein
MNETILQRDNPVRTFPNWRICIEASNVSVNTTTNNTKRHTRAA